MKSDAFLDTNVLIYAFDLKEPRAHIARALLADGGVISLQSFNEFVAVMRRKQKMAWNDVRAALAAILTLCRQPQSITIKTHEIALDIAERFGYRIFDSLIIASALEARCPVLFSEDLHNGQIIDGLVIKNPFLVT